ncbi:MAG: insulinase family protein [Planctomycetota bacterium]|nr:insulinase family protein [Planctomycetota bacterium]MDA1113970.1 insulinase family protein [Planctomycetota bacterium]
MIGSSTLILCSLMGCAENPVSVPAPQQTEDLKPLRIGADTFERRVLANGLYAVAIQEEAETATLFLAVSAGTRNETAAITGLAHLTEHAMFAGTPTTGTDVHEKTIVKWGGESNAYTRDDYTMYYDHEFPPAELAKVLVMEADRLVNLSLESAAVLHERYRLDLEEAHSYRSADGRKEEVEAAVFQLHPYRFGLRTPQGHTRAPGLSVETIEEFYREHYQPNRVAVVVVSPLAAGDALDAIEAAFSNLPSGPVAPIISQEPIPNRARLVAMRSALPRDRNLKVWLTPAYGEKGRVALEVLASLLARAELPSGAQLSIEIGGRTDRDMFQVGWTGEASVAAEVDALLNSYRDGSVFDDDSASDQLEEVKKLLIEGHNNQPLRARPYFAKAATVARFQALGLADAYASRGKDISKVSASDIASAARKWLSNSSVVTVTFLGTGEEIEPLPADVDGLAEAASAAQETGDYARAIEAYTRLLDLGPSRINTVIYYAERGGLYMEQSDFDSAIADFEAGLKVVNYPAVADMLEEAYARKARAMRGDFSD